MRVEAGRSLCCLKVSVNPLRNADIKCAFILPLKSNLIYDAGLFPTERNVVGLGRRSSTSSRPAFNRISGFATIQTTSPYSSSPNYGIDDLSWTGLLYLRSLP